ncbi:hypothetical protein CDD82_2335 [Ophiocordyceps australis]|uniref:Nudix hydrolase domain-containing protein n=1 Tax=Ophiocordyceps australis TaxID=1399860 RepID=A0A2C5ZJB5_9HYPO|nr:hypothetical protein CDD82_2335 [Ophiocordyceps australis]
MAQKSQMHLEDWLDDLCVRFIINLPQEDLSSVARICFQVEEAQWFYEDFIRPLDPTLPSMTLRTFCLRIFQHCPLLASFSIENHTKAFEEFLQYKTRVPVRGAIMLNQAMDSVVLVKGWKKGASWSFPRGKINKDEDDLDCAIREVYEETGLDLRAANLVPTGKKPKYIEITMREQQLRLYVFRNVPMDTHFQPRTRKEISKIQWYKLSELPTFRKKGAPTQQDTPSTSQINKFYMVAPFLVDLKKWIASLKKMEERRAASDFQVKHEQTPRNTISQHIWTQDAPMTEDNTRHSSYIVPAIDTLDGATKELQRLLRGQPPTQGIQPLPQLNVRSEDKGSALLSLLKANDGVLSQISQTPLDQIATKPPPPRNPHHRNNQQPVSWESYAQQSPGAFNQNHAASPFAHPQRHVSDSQIFIKASCPSQQLNILQKISQRHIDDQSPSQGPLKTGYSQQQLYQGQMPHRTVGALRPLPLQLNDHSMALLDAFKRDPTSGKTATHAGTSEHGQDVAAAPLKPGFGAQFPTLNTNIQDTTSKYSFPTEMSSEQRKPAPEMSADQLQSTLLQLFKQNSPQSVNRAQNWKRQQDTATEFDSFATPRAGDDEDVRAKELNANDRNKRG